MSLGIISTRRNAAGAAHAQNRGPADVLQVKPLAVLQAQGGGRGRVEGGRVGQAQGRGPDQIKTAQALQRLLAVAGAEGMPPGVSRVAAAVIAAGDGSIEEAASFEAASDLKYVDLRNSSRPKRRDNRVEPVRQGGGTRLQDQR